MRLRRRDFLQAIVVTAAAVPFSGCGSDDDGGGSTAADPDAEFPQGLASGDPKPDSVVLWTRAVPVSGSGSVKVRYEVALDEAFESMVAQGSVSVTEDSDWTVRIKPVGLEPYTQYYYRFKAGKMVSDVGRTKTAPTADQDVNVRFAFASCQDFIGRYYLSWKAFLEQEEPVDFVVWLGDYIYETNGDPDFQLNDPNRKIDIQDGIQLLPDSDPTVKAASSLADYRGIYKQYRADENLRKAHQMFPFITIWDDHEFANDCWQDHSTDFNEAKGEEKNTPRREAASQAWFEYQAADVDWDAAAAFPNDLTIYRTLRYGKHVELILTDQRSYRSDHVIPEAATGGQKPEGAPADVPTYAEAGKLSAHSSLGSRNFVRKAGFDKIEAYVKPTMLGDEQKKWLIDTVKGSNATWKIWGNETQLVQMALDLSSFQLPALFQGNYYFTVDQWDGYRTERTEILNELSGVTNLVAITGDIHAFYAGELYVDFDNPTPTPMAVEYVTAGISSSPAQEITENTVNSSDALKNFGLGDLVPQFDTILTSTSPHYKYAKSLSHGIAIMEVDGDKEVRVTFVQIADVKSPTWDGTAERVKFRTASGSNTVEIVS